MTAYVCPLCGRGMVGNGARTSHIRRHQREERAAKRKYKFIRIGPYVRGALADALEAEIIRAASAENRRSDRLAEVADALEAEVERRYGPLQTEE